LYRQGPPRMLKTEQILSETTRKALSVHVAKWIKVELSIQRADRNAAEQAVKESYQIVGLAPPARFLWLDSPMAGAIAATLASRVFGTIHERVWKKPQEFMTAKFWRNLSETETPFWHQIQEHLNHSTLLVLRNGLLAPVTQQIAHPAPAAPPAKGSTFIPGRMQQADMPIQLWNQTATRLKSALTQKELAGLNFAPSWQSMSQQVRFCGFGSMDAQFLAFLDYCLLSGFKVKDISGLVSLARSCGWWWAFAEICILTERPLKIILAGDGNLHSEKEYAIEYPDHWGIFALHGAAVPRSLARFAGNMRVQDIEAERNLEIRHQMIDMYGIEQFIQDSGAEVVQEDSCGILYRKTLVDEEPIVMARVVNSTPELDGTYTCKECFLRVPPHISSVLEAIDWSFGKDARNYSPKVQA